MYDTLFYILAFTALSPVFWYVGALFNSISHTFMHTEADGTRSHSAISAIAALLGTLCYFATVAGGLVVLAGVAIGAGILLLVGGAILLVIMVPLMVGSLIMSLILEPIIARSTGNGPAH